MWAPVHGSRMAECQVQGRLGQTGNYSGIRGPTAQIESLCPPRTENQERETRKNQHLVPTRFYSDGRHSKNSQSYRKPAWSPWPSVDASSMASAENELETSNTNISEGEQQPPATDRTLGQNKLSRTEPFRYPYFVDDNPTPPNPPAQPSTSPPISNQDSGAATPNPIHPGDLEGRDIPSFRVSQLLQPATDQHGPSPVPEHSTVSIAPLHSASNPEQTSETRSTVREAVGEARPTDSGIPAAELTSKEDYEIILIEETNGSDDDDNKSLDLDLLCTQDREEKGYMTLIPYSLSPVEPPKAFIKPPKTELQRVAQLRLDVRYLRLEIQNLKSLLQAKDQQIFDENEETFKRLREFVTERHRRPKFHDSRLELASRLFFASRSSRDACGPLIGEINSLEEKLAFEEIKLTQAEDSLYESFGIPPMEPEEAQRNGFAVPGLPISHPRLKSESEHTAADHINKAGADDGGSYADAYSTGSFEKYRIKYHPLYIKYQRQVGAQDSLYERHAHYMADMVRLKDQQENRHRVGLNLLKDDQEFLDSLPGIIQLLEIEIKQSLLEIERLKTQCLEQGIIDEDDNYINDDGEVSNSGSDSDSDSDSDDSPPPPPPFPPSAPPVPTLPPQISVPPNPSSSLPASARSVIVSNLHTRLDDQSYQTRINPWLLGKLAASRTELTLLATILTAMDAEPDVASLRDVLNLWDHDGAGVEPPQRPGKLDEATLNRLRRVTRGVVGDGFDRALVSSLFGLSLWGGEAYGGGDGSAYLDD